MTRPGDHVICAVSGGKDSMALLHVLWTLSASFSLTVTAAHMNHQLRGEESLRDASFVRDFCRERDIPLEMRQADVSGYARTHGLGLEESARKLRYDFLLELDPAAKIATAHTAEDNLETLLMHLIRGSGLHGLTGIPPVRQRIIRPLLTVSRGEIDAYLIEHQLPHVEDSTNRLDHCLRNRIRHRVLPLLEAENPNLPETVSRLTKTLRLEDSFMEDQAGRALEGAVTGGVLSISALRDQPEAIARRMLRQFLQAAPGLSGRQLDGIMALCRGDSPSAQYALSGGYKLTRVYDGIQLLPKEAEMPPEEIRLETEGTYRFGAWEIICRIGTAPARLPEGTLALAQRELTAPLTLRRRRSGDKLRLPGGSKKLSRLLIDWKIPAYQRDAIPVVSMGDTVVAVLSQKAAVGYGAGAGEASLLLTAKQMEE